MISEHEEKTIVNRLKGVGHNSWIFPLGTFAIRNRSQTDIEKGATPECVCDICLKKEEKNCD